MIEPKKYYVAGILQTSVELTDSMKGRWIVYRKPVDLINTNEKMDRALADIRTQIEFLRRERTSLGLVRGQLVAMEAEWRGE